MTANESTESTRGFGTIPKVHNQTACPKRKKTVWWARRTANQPGKKTETNRQLGKEGRPRTEQLALVTFKVFSGKGEKPALPVGGKPSKHRDQK